jgi:hypothetical protein
LQRPHRAQLLVAASVAQLGSGLAGMVVALRRKHPYDVAQGYRGRFANWAAKSRK